MGEIVSNAVDLTEFTIHVKGLSMLQNDVWKDSLSVCQFVSLSTNSFTTSI